MVNPVELPYLFKGGFTFTFPITLFRLLVSVQGIIVLVIVIVIESLLLRRSAFDYD